MRTITCFFLFICFCSHAQKRIAITFDDLPSASPRISLAHTTELNTKLLATLNEFNVPAIGFVNEAEVEVMGETKQRVNILRQWVNQGHALGNHTYSHSNYNTMEFEAYAAEISKGEVHTRKVLQERNRPLTYFRPPYLNTGTTKAAKEKLERFLADNGYEMAPATIEASDHIFNLLYLKAKVANDTAAMNAVTRDYLNLILQRLQHYEKLSVESLGTDIPHVYLCHVNDLNADNLDQVLRLLQRSGYTFIPLDDVMRHPVYQQPDPYIGTKGLTWVDRWQAMDNALKGNSRPPVPPRVRTAYDASKSSQFWFLLRPRIQGLDLPVIQIGIMLLVSLVLIIAFIKLKPLRRLKT